MINKKSTSKVAKIAFVGAIALSVVAQPLSSVAHAATFSGNSVSATSYKLGSPLVDAVAPGSKYITGTAMPGAMIHAKINNNFYSAFVDNNGQFSLKLPTLTNVTNVEISQTFDFKTFSVSTVVTVSPYITPSVTPPTPSENPGLVAPTVNPVSAGDKYVTGTATPGSVVQTKINGAYNTDFVGKDGKFSINIPFLYANTIIEVSQTLDFKTFSAASIVVVK
ncbi:hypothetical protein HCJ57_04005 [Listeria booriae]|uniref:Uncharacterized protein n=1 Tax=Listeria booriae TaxID=1552123 RepID=A0A099W5S5_9LIST|nr:Ig-like domain-containing protein [Listeria booriae]KGL39763.1 hypothetical protein EP57_11920 [Listeria booriae]MBC1898131.1 hypothetical protein [Listeria booriae]MBC1907061.1 hypothetical protein [Listeria booriae]MBC2055651.1 hypothetical protein [Listeria booriae]MBC2099560.1 hypothetical protein [Listeria booriae]